MNLRSKCAVVACAAAAMVGGAVPTASAGLIDGSLNNATMLSASNVLGALAGSQLSDASNNNANTKAEGTENNAINN